jgi:cyanate permease
LHANAPLIATRDWASAAQAGPLLARTIRAERAVVIILLILVASALLRSPASTELLQFSAER